MQHDGSNLCEKKWGFPDKHQHHTHVFNLTHTNSEKCLMGQTRALSRAKTVKNHKKSHQTLFDEACDVGSEPKDMPYPKKALLQTKVSFL